MTSPQSRHFLVTPSGLADDAALARFANGLEAASLLIAEGPEQAALAKALTNAAQAKGIAVLIEYDVELAKVVEADGVMTGGSLKVWTAAKAALPKGAIVGARCTSRHQAMELAEAGADFIAFTTRDLIDWWGEIFQVPCVSLIPGDDAPNADFIRPSDTMWTENAP
jgi:thiamine-phosphate pyrophosphorylase